MAAYATRRDLYRFGLARGSLSMPGRHIESAVASTNTLTLDGHGLETDDEVLVRAEAGGTLAAPLVEGTTYYAIRLTDSTFRLAASAGGVAIDLTTDGDLMIVATPLPVDDVLEMYSRFVDGFVPAHAVPLVEPYPTVVVATVAELASKKLMSLSGQTSVSVIEAEAAAKMVLERWAKGIPMRDARATTATNKAISTTLRGGGDPRGWGSERLP